MRHSSMLAQEAPPLADEEARKAPVHDRESAAPQALKPAKRPNVFNNGSLEPGVKRLGLRLGLAAAQRFLRANK